MNVWQQVRFMLGLTRSHGILRRYFVVNGFDGALTMLGLILGFYLTESPELTVVIAACLGAAIALGVSGVSSAYISEVAERRLALAELEGAMVKDLSTSAHGLAARWVPLLTAIVNGSSPFLLSLLILLPLWLAQAGMPLPIPPLPLAMMVALCILFLLGVFLGRIAGVSWWRSGLQTLLIALVTAGLILLVEGMAQ